MLQGPSTSWYNCASHIVYHAPIMLRRITQHMHSFLLECGNENYNEETNEHHDG
jgi:hypothetical protein